MRLESKALDLEFKADAEAGTFAGYGSVFATIDAGRDIVDPGAYDRTLPRFLDKGFVAFAHHWDRPIGKPIAAHVDPRGLFVTGQLSDTPDGKTARTLMRDRVIQGLSIGYEAKAMERLEKESDVEDYWRAIRYNPTDRDLMAKRGGKVRLLKELELYEVSPVAVPMNGLCDITAAKMLPFGSPQSFDEQFDMALAAVRALHDRAADLADLKAADGRRLSEHRMAQLKTLRDDLSHIIAEAEADPEEALRLLAQFEATCARAAGVAC